MQCRRTICISILTRDVLYCIETVRSDVEGLSSSHDCCKTPHSDFGVWYQFCGDTNLSGFGYQSRLLQDIILYRLVCSSAPVKARRPKKCVESVTLPSLNVLQLIGFTERLIWILKQTRRRNHARHFVGILSMAQAAWQTATDRNQAQVFSHIEFRLLSESAICLHESQNIFGLLPPLTQP